MSNILLLGPGKSRARIDGKPEFGIVPDEVLTVLDYDKVVLAEWQNSAECVSCDLRYGHLWPLSNGSFDAVHAYEVLNLLPGDEYVFFRLWRDMWRVLKPNGRVYATTPHWQSRWIHAYPGQQRVYTPELLAYLDHGKHLTAKSDFPDLWPLPYNFVTVEAWDVCAHPEAPPQGFQFVLEKK